MRTRHGLALVVLVLGAGVVVLGCAVTYGLLREYGDVCGDTEALEQVWLGGAGLGPLVAGVAAAVAVLVVVIGGHRLRLPAAGLVVLAVVGATVSGAAGVGGKRAAFEEDPATYGTCGGYNSESAPG